MLSVPLATLDGLPRLLLGCCGGLATLLIELRLVTLDCREVLPVYVLAPVIFTVPWLVELDRPIPRDPLITPKKISSAVVPPPQPMVRLLVPRDTFPEYVMPAGMPTQFKD